MHKATVAAMYYVPYSGRSVERYITLELAFFPSLWNFTLGVSEQPDLFRREFSIEL